MSGIDNLEKIPFEPSGKSPTFDKAIVEESQRIHLQVTQRIGIDGFLYEITRAKGIFYTLKFRGAHEQGDARKVQRMKVGDSFGLGGFMYHITGTTAGISFRIRRGEKI